MLGMITEEAEKANSRPRATAEVRNQSGQSLLSIAAQVRTHLTTASRIAGGSIL